LRASGLLIVAAAFARTAAGQAAALDPAVEEAEAQRVAVMAKAKAAVLAIFSSTGGGGGSGVVISADGFALSNYHVVSACGNAMKCGMADGKVYDAVIVGIDPTGDVALIKLFGRDDFPAAEMGDSDQVRVGDWAFAMGNPFLLATDFQPTVTYGIVSGVHRYQYPAGTLLEYADCIQTDASINPGNSGGPLLDSAGRLIGINTAIISPSGSSAGIGFAVPVDVIKRVVPQLIEFGKIKRAGLGISLIRDDLARRWRISGVIVRSVVEGGPADRAGIRSLEADRSGRATSFDVIVGVDGTKVEKYDDLYRALDQREPGDEVEVRYRRGDREHKARVRLMELE